MLGTEFFILKDDGLATIAVSSVAGMSVSVSAVLLATNPEVAEYVGTATAQIAFAVVVTSIITPFLAKKLMAHRTKKKGSVLKTQAEASGDIK